MIRIERDPAFWARIAGHPEVAPHVTMGREVDWAASVGSDLVTPLAAEHGGFLFVRLDGVGRVQELHTMFTPEGWGREVLMALKHAVERIFADGAQLITTYEVEGHWRSQPPKTFRFMPCGDFAPIPGGEFRIRTWCLPWAAWEASPARRRM